MDFAKFVSLISSQSLYFTRLDIFKDPFEYSYSKANVHDWQERLKHLGAEIPAEMGIFQIAKIFKTSTYASCWHLNKHESAAMWKLYAESNQAVAVQTTYRRLVDVLPDNLSPGPAGRLHDIIFVSRVKYIDYEKDRLPEGQLLSPVIHKRLSFSHEQEVRAFFIVELTQDLQPDPQKGKAVKVNLSELIEKVHVAPAAPDWYRNVVKEVMNKYEIDKPVISSSLDDRPVY